MYLEIRLILFSLINFSYFISNTNSATCSYNVSGSSYPCEPVTTTTCLGSSLPFTHTSKIFANDSATVAEVQEKLALWYGLQAAPECWAVVQPYLCSVYMPKCDNTTGEVELPSKELCQRTRTPCSIVERYKGWPAFLDCSNWYFEENCETLTYESLTFNTTATCNLPLIRTENKDSWYTEVEGCGIQCQNPLFTEAEHDQVHIFIAVFGALCIICTLFTLLTFAIDWKNASRYPALILFFINGCFFLGSIGWMAQFSGDARTDIVCKADGTVRIGEPNVGSGETASCTIVFIIVYYFMMAGCTWFVMLAFAWYLTFKALGTPRDSLSNKTAYFHIASWCFPLVLTIICLAISEIDGDSVSGICFVGYQQQWVRGVFVLLPISVVLVVGMFFLILGLITLVKLKKNTPDFVSDKATTKIRETILRLGIFSLVAFIFVVITFSVHVYIFTNEQSWADSFKSYIYCQANVTVTKGSINNCKIEDRPSLAAMQIHIFAFFGAGIAMSSWSWTKASILSWERLLRKIFKKPSNKPVKLKKHKMIAKAFERRKELNNGRLSISFASTHDDPLGMKFDLNSVSSHEMSSSFAAAMPKLVRRRGGMIHPTAGTLRRYSDSDIGSVASKMASRRQSLDSQLSQAQGQFHSSDQDKEYINETKKKKKKKKRKNKRNRIQPVLAPIGHAANLLKQRRSQKAAGRRGSDTSHISRASAHSVQVSLERNSVEGMSLASISHEGSLEAATLPTPPKTLKTDYALFTASSYMEEMSKKMEELRRQIEEDKKRERAGLSQKGQVRDTSAGSSRAIQTRENSAGSSKKSGSRINSANSSKKSGTRDNSAGSFKLGGLRQNSAGSSKIGGTRQNSASSSKKGGSRQSSATSSQRAWEGTFKKDKGRVGSGSSLQRGRAREVKLEMTERTFYREQTKGSNSASSQASKARQSSAKSDLSQPSLPGEITVVQIENEDIDDDIYVDENEDDELSLPD